MTDGFAFRVEARSSENAARAGRLETPHGPVETPVFMPIGTKGSVKGVLPDQLRGVGSRMLLANTYHLHLRPGEEVVRSLGGLHGFMGWDGPILTDSGGFQVFSLAEKARIDEDGTELVSIVDGTRFRLEPENAMRIQADLGADVVMAFDHCPPDPRDRQGVADATERTHRWLARCVESWRAGGGTASGQALFGIVQGGAFEDLRRASVEAVCEHDLPGYAIGGVSVGEDRESMNLAVEAATAILPEPKPRYLMGVGTPRDFFDAVSRGVDMFDCVTPTRHARNHQVFTSRGRANLRNERWRTDPRPLDPDCPCPCCRNFSRGYLRHLCVSNEMLAGTLLTLHNLQYFHALLEAMRTAIPTHGFEELRRRVLEACEGRLD